MTVRTLILAVALAGAAHAEPLRFKEHGFSIKPLAGHGDGATQQVLSMSLPAADGFAANVNVQVQPFPGGSFDDYIKLSMDQLKQAGIQLLAQKRAPDGGLTLEYVGMMQGNKLHWYQRALLQGGKVILATATALDTAWARQSAELKATVDTLKPEK